VLRCLIYMHKLGIVHRDIKPENMLFQNEEQNIVKLIDFGIAKKIDGNNFLTDRIGTPHYIAPEIIYKQYNEKCDIWAAGVSFYQFISGRTPFTGEDDR
jgi:calcium-dependent protein kinase